MRYRKRAEQWTVITLFLFGGISISSAEEVTDASLLPDLELLEYLGAWQPNEDEWLDPMQLFEIAENSITVKVKNEKRRDND